MSKQVERVLVYFHQMEALPMCEFCPTTAEYDTKTSLGRWAYACPTCYTKWGVGKLGTGYGQKLITT